MLTKTRRTKERKEGWQRKECYVSSNDGRNGKEISGKKYEKMRADLTYQYYWKIIFLIVVMWQLIGV